MSYILVTAAPSPRRYIKHTPCRFDNKRVIITTKELKEAKTFTTMAEAHTLLSKCITNTKFITEPIQTN
jgi:hypothetical protein